MRISVIGCGYLGAVHAACMAELGHEVVGVDVDQAKIDALSAGKAPFFEPGLPELLLGALSSGRLSFTTDTSQIKGSQVHFIAVGTPQKQGDYAADMTYVDAAVEGMIPHLSPGDIVVGKSTVPVGTARAIAERLAEAAPEATLAWNPEFLREGFAVKDTLTPDRLVYGLPTEDSSAAAVLDKVYASAIQAATPVVRTDYETAELVKVSANAFLATKISFINAMADVCDAAGADVTRLADAIGYDERIGRKFLNAGLGFGGGCLPKDIRAFMARGAELGVDTSLKFLREVDSVNVRRRSRMVDMTREACGGSILGKKIAILGLAFKPNSDDVRDSPALNVAAQLQLQGATVLATDPVATENARRRFPELTFVETVHDAVHKADVVLLLTEWNEYKEIDPFWLGDLVKSKNIVDGRNCLEPSKWRQAGWIYRALGRP